MSQGGQGPEVVAERLLESVNAHDLEGMVGCFAEDYVNATPTHPQRSFLGNQQVRHNRTLILAGVPDLQARLPRTAVDGNTVWTEWDFSGTRSDGAAFLMRGVVILAIDGAVITSARFYLETVEDTSSDVNFQTGRVLGALAEDVTGMKS